MRIERKDSIHRCAFVDILPCTEFVFDDSPCFKLSDREEDFNAVCLDSGTLMYLLPTEIVSTNIELIAKIT